jgi:hypothetical protein
MPQVQIALPAALSDVHLRVAIKYFEKTNRLTPKEWKTALETFDTLHKATVTVGRRRMTFQQAYDRLVDVKYAGAFIDQLMALKDPDDQGETIQQETARAILRLLEEEGLYCDDVSGSEYLAAYCLYWWTAFARGYRFELSIYADLRASSINFVAHDLRDRKERRSPYDLVVQRQLGDVKTTTYFLHTACRRPLTCDFYITRLYHVRRRCYLPVVVLTEAAWRVWNGPVTRKSLEAAADLFPHPVGVLLEGRGFVIVPYDLWKDKVKQRQQQET